MSTALLRGVVATVLCAAMLLWSGCSSHSDDAELAGLWQPYPSSNVSVARLTLAPDHTFHAAGWMIQLRCERAVYTEPKSATNMWATGHWTFDADTLQLKLRYDAPADRRCKVPELPPLVVDRGMGETDLLVYPDGVDHLASRIRLGRIRPSQQISAAHLAADQVACFRARGRWARVCMAQEYRCLTRYADGGRQCQDSSQCEGMCVADLTVRCEPGAACVDPPVPAPGTPFTGRCQRDDDECGGFVEIRNGQAEPMVSID